VVVFNCFKGLGEFEVDSQEAITNGFLENVVEQQGWEEDVDVDEFQKAIKRKAALNYEEGKFFTSGEEKQKQADKKKQLSQSRS
jgi:hypothetical protein